MTENLNLKTVDTVDTGPFRKLVMTIGELPTAFVESMTYYELLAWFTNYLETVIIPTVNNNGECVQELQDKFIELDGSVDARFKTLTDLFKELKNYVDTYFENLDVQEEVNNKLDEMAEDGTLQEIITTYIQSNVAWTFDSVADMKLATNLIAGSYAHTYGYSSVDDKGGAYYKIVDDNTLVEDGGYIHDVYGGLKAVLVLGNVLTPQTFGIFGDGETDVTLSLKYFLTFCSNHDVKTYFPAGTYILDNDKLVIKLGEGKGISIEGDNRATVFKRKSGELGPTKFNRLFMFRAEDANTVDTGDIMIKNIMIDSNRRGQSNATDDYTYESSGNLNFNGHANSYLSNVYIDNVYCYDPVADDIIFVGSTECFVRNVYINNFLSEHRMGTRHDLDFTGYVDGNIYISNCKGANLNFEFNQKNPERYYNAFVTDCEFKHLNFDGKINVIISNLIMTEKMLFDNNPICRFENSTFTLDGVIGRSLIASATVDFDNCKFFAEASELYSSATNPSDVNFISIREDCKININNSTFEYIGEVISEYDEGRNYFISTQANNTSACTINITNTKFTGANIYCAICFANNVFNFKDCDFGDTNNIWIKRVVGKTNPAVSMNNIKLNDSKPFMKLTGATTLTGNNLFCTPSSFFIIGTAANFNESTIDVHRKIYLSEPLTSAYLTSLMRDGDTTINICKNDEFILNSANNPQKWIAITKIANRVDNASSSIENHVNDMFNVVSENARGTTANRPTCYLSKGFQYYDETLGKPIWYTGSAWVDATGTSV